MFRSLPIILIGIFTVFSCSRPDVPEIPGPEEDLVTVTFAPGDGQTRLSSVTDANERRVERWALYLFDGNGNHITHGVFTRASETENPYITLSVNPGTYRACAVVNYPTAKPGQFSPTAMTLSALRGVGSFLQNNAYNRLLMYGETQVELTSGSALMKTIPVSRLVSRVGIGSVTVDMTNPVLAAQQFTIRRLFLTNVHESSTYGADIAASDMNWQRTRWYNTVGYHTSGSGYMGTNAWVTGTDSGLDALTSESLTLPMSDGATVQLNRYFYCYPNPTTEAQDIYRNDAWANWRTRRTRLVIEATLGSQTYYYPISISEMARNMSYFAGAVTIRRPGSLDPEQEIDGTVDVTFAVDPGDWTGPMYIDEES